MILVVEDEVLVRLDIAEYLRGEGYTVLEAASGDEALTVFGAVDEVDLVFSDINMPGALDGKALAIWLSENNPQIPVILTSGIQASLQDAKTACPTIAATFDKPYSQAAVADQIRAQLALSSAARAGGA
ncbi:MAG: response regulator [Caulobacterales bacterium]